MAQLVWRPVEAQQGSTRDLAIAGQTIGNSFDRMGQMLINREEALKKEATGAATAEAFMASTPEQIAALRARGLAGLDKRVDKAAFAQSLGTAESDMLARTKTREEVLNILAASQLGDEGAAYLGMLNSGDREGAKKLATDMASQFPDQWGRVAYGYAKDGEPLSSGWETRTEQKRSNKEGERLTAQGQQLSYQVGMAGVAAQNARTALERDQINERKAQQAAQDQARLLGQTFAGSNVARDPNAVLIQLQNSEAYLKAPPAVKAAMEDGFIARHKSGLRLSSEERAAVRPGQKFADVPVVSGFGRLVGEEIGRQNTGQETELRTKSPAMDIALRAEKHRDATVEQATTYLDSLSDVGFGESSFVRNQMARNPGLTPAMIMAAADRVGPTISAGGLYSELREMFPEAVKYQDQGGAALARQVIGQANQGRNADANKMKSLEAAAKRAQKAGNHEEAARLRDEARGLYQQYFKP